MKKKEEKREEYFLLYYGKWEWENELAEAFPLLPYCVPIEDLSNNGAVRLALHREINNFITDQDGNLIEGAGRKYHGFSPHDTCGEEPDEGFYTPFYELRSRQSISEMFWLECREAIDNFAKAYESGTDATTAFMYKVSQHAVWVRTYSGKLSLNFKALTSGKGTWIPVGESVRLTDTNVKILENRRAAKGSERVEDKKRKQHYLKGRDSEGRYWKLDGKPLKKGKKSKSKLICWYWVTHEELDAWNAKTMEPPTPQNLES